MYSVDKALAALNARGFTYVRASGEGPAPFTLLYVYGWGSHIDALHVRGEHDTTGVRALNDHGRSSIFTDGNIVWKEEGSFVAVVGELLRLPAPGQPGAPTRTIKAPSRLWTPHH